MQKAKVCFYSSITFVLNLGFSNQKANPKNYSKEIYPTQARKDRTYAAQNA